MYKKLTILFYKKFLNKVFYYFFQKNIKINLINTNFQNLLFENIDELKKVYLSKKNFRNDIINDSDYHSHSFNVINIGKIIGGERNVNCVKNIFFNGINKTTRYFQIFGLINLLLKDL